MKEKIKELYNKDNNIAYKVLLKLEANTTESNELYDFFNDFLNMIKSDKTFIKKRGFSLICHISRWDIDDKIKENIDNILTVFDNDNGILARQCLGKINLILLYKPELSSIIEKKLRNINIYKYKESMQSLIKKDIETILNNL